MNCSLWITRRERRRDESGRRSMFSWGSSPNDLTNRSSNQDALTHCVKAAEPNCPLTWLSHDMVIPSEITGGSLKSQSDIGRIIVAAGRNYIRLVDLLRDWTTKQSQLWSIRAPCWHESEYQPNQSQVENHDWAAMNPWIWRDHAR